MKQLIQTECFEEAGQQWLMKTGMQVWKSIKYWQMTGAISSYFQILETGMCGFITNFTKSDEVQYKTVISEAGRYPFESSPASY